MADTQTIGPYTVGEKPAPLVYQFLDSAGSPLDISGWQGRFSYRRRDAAGSSAVTVEATITDGASGKVTHVWTGSEFSTGGEWWCEFWVGNGTNRYASKRLEATVRAAVSTPPSI